MTIMEKTCWERGCACYDSRVDKDGVEVVEKREWVGLTDVDKSQLAQKYKHIETGTEHDENLIAETEAKLKEKNT